MKPARDISEGIVNKILNGKCTCSFETGFSWNGFHKKDCIIKVLENQIEQAIEADRQSRGLTDIDAMKPTITHEEILFKAKEWLVSMTNEQLIAKIQGEEIKFLEEKNKELEKQLSEAKGHGIGIKNLLLQIRKFIVTACGDEAPYVKIQLKMIDDSLSSIQCRGSMTEDFKTQGDKGKLPSGKEK